MTPSSNPEVVELLELHRVDIGTSTRRFPNDPRTEERTKLEPESRRGSSFVKSASLEHFGALIRRPAGICGDSQLKIIEGY